MARADKQRRAMTATRAIAERLMSAPLRSAHEVAVAHLAMAWSHRVQRMVHDQARGADLGGLGVEDHAAALTAAARGFSAYSLEPWLERRMKPAAMRGILALLPSEPRHVLSAVEGLDPDAAHRILRRIAEQLEAELRETLMALPPRGEDMPSELPDTVRNAAGALAAWTAAAQDEARA
jgi:hypothetical protein